MKILIKKYYLLFIIVIILLLWSTIYYFSIGYISNGYIKKLNQIWTLLNHQDLESASVTYKEIQSYSGNEVIPDLDYDYFIMRTWLVITMLEDDFPRRVRELIALRLQYFPSEKDNAKILSMIGDNWFSENCKGNEQGVVDSIEIGFCWMRNKKIDDSQKKVAVGDLIKNLSEKIIQRKNIQEMSDLGNLIGMYQNTYKDPSLYEYQKTLWKSIITMDPHFVNWYIIFISGNISNTDNQKQVNQEIFDQMKKNYIWDKSQYDYIIPQYAKAFNLKE